MNEAYIQNLKDLQLTGNEHLILCSVLTSYKIHLCDVESCVLCLNSAPLIVAILE